MKMKIVKTIALILAMICILCFPVPASAVSQGTDGTELQMMKPQNLEIHLGEGWAGAGFELTTDAGKYPGIIVVGAVMLDVLKKKNAAKVKIPVAEKKEEPSNKA